MLSKAAKALISCLDHHISTNYSPQQSTYCLLHRLPQGPLHFSMMRPSPGCGVMPAFSMSVVELLWMRLPWSGLSVHKRFELQRSTSFRSSRFQPNLLCGKPKTCSSHPIPPHLPKSCGSDT